MEGLLARFADTLPPEQLAEVRAQLEAMPIHPFWLALVQGMIAGPTVNTVAALGEELGWRGYLQRELAHLGFWRASAVIGLVWGLWHAPLILHGHNYPAHPVAGVALMVVFSALLAPIFAYARVRGGSVLAAAIMHGTVNAVGGLAVMMLAGGTDLTVGLTGAAGLAVLALANVALFAYDRRPPAI